MDSSEKNPKDISQITDVSPETADTLAQTGNTAPARAASESSAAPPPAGSPPAEPSDRAFIVLSALIITLAAVVRFAFIGRYQVWLDEAYSFMVARHSVGEILGALRLDNGPPLHYVMLHYWMKIFGDGPWALRALSAVFSTAAVAAVVYWDAPWFPRRARLWAGFLFAITPIAIYYAQEARMYSVVLFFTLMSVIYLERGLRAGGWRNWAAMAAFTALGLYTSYVVFFLLPLGFIVIAAMYLSGVDRRLLLRRSAGLVAALAAAGLLFTPWLPIFAKQPSKEATSWIGPVWRMENRALLPVQSLAIMSTGGAYYPKYLRHLAHSPSLVKDVKDFYADRPAPFQVKLATAVPPVIPFVLAGALLAATVGAALARGGSGFPARTMLAAWVLLSILVPFAVSFVGNPIFVAGRYEITGVPALAILMGIGLSRMPRRLAAALAAGLVALFLYAYASMYSWPSTGVYREKAEALATSVEKGDVIIAEAFEYVHLYYYMGARRDDFTWLTFPREIKDHAGWIYLGRWLHDGAVPKAALWEEASLTVAKAIDAAAPGGAVVILKASGTPLPEWAVAMDKTMAAAVMGAARRGLLEQDLAATKADKDIIVMRRPR